RHGRTGRAGQPRSSALCEGPRQHLHWRNAGRFASRRKRSHHALWAIEQHCDDGAGDYSACLAAPADRAAADLRSRKRWIAKRLRRRRGSRRAHDVARHLNALVELAAVTATGTLLRTVGRGRASRLRSRCRGQWPHTSQECRRCSSGAGYSRKTLAILWTDTIVRPAGTDNHQPSLWRHPPRLGRGSIETRIVPREPDCSAAQLVRMPLSSAPTHYFSRWSAQGGEVSIGPSASGSG